MEGAMFGMNYPHHPNVPPIEWVKRQIDDAVCRLSNDDSSRPPTMSQYASGIDIPCLIRVQNKLEKPGCGNNN